MSELATVELSSAMRASERSRASELAKNLEKLIRSEGVTLQLRKDQLLEELGMKRERRISSSFETIVNAYFFLKELGIGNIDKVVKGLPAVLGYNTESMQTRVDFLKELGIGNIDKVVERQPQVLELNTEYMQVRVDFLKELGIGNIGKVVERLPQVLGSSTESMQTRVDFLKELGIGNIGKVVERLPAVLGYSTESMQTRVDFLKELGIGNIGKVVERQPQVLEYNTEYMQRKVDYLIGNVHLTIENLESTPSLLGLSLGRIKARWEYFKNEAPLHYEKFNKSWLFCTTDSDYIEIVRRFSVDANLGDYTSFVLSVKSKAT